MRGPGGKWLLFAIGAAAIFLRSPRLFFEPRFWAEEASFFSYAFHHSALSALARPDGGNYDLPRNLASVLAVHLAPVEWAPLVTTLFSFGIMLIPLILILHHSLLKTTLTRAVAIAFYLVVSQTEEIWLTTLHSQRYLSVAAFLILLDEPSPARRFKTWLQRLLLLTAGLAGPESVFLAPMFLLKWLMDRRRENLVQVALISACAVLQFSTFLLFPSELSRSSPLNLETFTTIVWTKSIMLPFLGNWGIWPFEWAYNHASGVSGYVLGIGLLLALIALLYAFSRRVRSRERILIVGSFVLTTVFSIAFAIGDKSELISEYGGARYFYATNFMLALLLLLNVDVDDVVRKRRFSVWTVLLILMLLAGANRFRKFGGFFTSWEIPWRGEVATWRNDPNYALRVWPDGWTVKLDPKQRDSQ